MSAEVKWKADCMSFSCQGLCSELASEQRAGLACLGLCVLTALAPPYGSALTLAAAPETAKHVWHHLQVPLSFAHPPRNLPTPSAALCPTFVELSLLPLWLSLFRLSHFFQPQSACTSRHIIFSTSCAALVCYITFKGSHWLPALNTFKNKITQIKPQTLFLAPLLGIGTIPFNTKGKSTVISTVSKLGSVCTSSWVFTSQMKITFVSEGGVGVYNAMACGGICLIF